MVARKSTFDCRFTVSVAVDLKPSNAIINSNLDTYLNTNELTTKVFKTLTHTHTNNTDNGFESREHITRPIYFCTIIRT